MRLRVLPPLLAALLAVGPAVATSVASAQYPGGAGPSGGMGSRRGWGGGARVWGRGGRGRGSFDPSAFPTPEDIDGPPTPGASRQLLALSDRQADAYQHAWDSLMTATGPERDSARGKDLRKRNAAFDKSLSFLSDDQRKQYADRENAQRTAREDERRQRFRGGPGGDNGPQAPA